MTLYTVFRLCFASTLSILLLAACGGGSSTPAVNTTPTPTEQPGDMDLRDVSTDDDGLLRLYGSNGQGRSGVPVAGGVDVNGDGLMDFAMASILSSPESRSGAGEVYLVLGDGTVSGTVDSGTNPSNMLTIIGDDVSELTGSSIWMADVTGDGLGDLLIGRQNHSPGSKTGAGAVSIVVGSSQLTTLAASGEAVDLRAPPSEINVLTVTGAAALDRLGIWLRAGDITGDGIDDLALGADQSDTQGSNSGTVYVLRGGSHLDTTATIDLSSLTGTAISGNVATVQPPSTSGGFHFGATLNVGDLDNNGSAELMVGATVNRCSASIPAAGAASNTAQAVGGSPNGRLFIIWDDSFPSTWTDDLTITSDDTAIGGITDIQGASTGTFDNDYFGEEIVGGLDYNGDGLNDLFVGDITGDTPRFLNAGLGFVFFDAAQLKNQNFTMNAPPTGLSITTILGAGVGTISSDTALHGDFDNDGIADLGVASPHLNPLGRSSAGTLHILWGQSVWPDTIDLAADNQPDASEFNVTNIHGANGTVGSDTGDTLAYSAANADMDGDGLVDLIINEMIGNGTTPESEDAGNLIIIGGDLLSTFK